MPFFDKKEDVLDFKLTPYGRQLLSKGRLMPKYYSFLDEDVVYDTKHADYTEDNNQIKTRIIDETPSLKPIYTVTSVELEINDNQQLEVKEGPDSYEHLANLDTTAGYYSTILGQELATTTLGSTTNIYNNYRPTTDINTKYLQNTIGTSKQGEKHAPRWNITFIRGEVESATNHITASVSSSVDFNQDFSKATSLLHIPQIECELNYVMEVKSADDVNQYDQDTTINEGSLNLQPIELYDDNTYLNISEEQMILDVLEKHGFIHDDSFEIEVFKFDNTNKDQLEPLKFLRKRKRIVKDILLDEPIEYNDSIDETTVEYYFDLRVDEEIRERDICLGVNELKSQGIFINDFSIVCPDITADAALNPALPPGDPCDPPGEECD